MIANVCPGPSRPCCLLKTRRVFSPPRLLSFRLAKFLTEFPSFSPRLPLPSQSIRPLFGHPGKSASGRVGLEFFLSPGFAVSSAFCPVPRRPPLPPAFALPPRGFVFSQAHSFDCTLSLSPHLGFSGIFRIHRYCPTKFFIARTNPAIT